MTKVDVKLRVNVCVQATTHDCVVTTPRWYLDDVVMDTVTKFDILGYKCRRDFYSLSNVGMNYPGLNNISNSQLYRSICLQTLPYGLDCIYLS